MTADVVQHTGFGAALRRFRASRRMSQLELANACDISARHLSFLESGRARPSRAMIMQLCSGLVLPLASRNALLQAAGFMPVFPTSPLNSEALGPFRRVLDEMMARHAPNPALLVDRHWTVREANAAARALLTALQAGDGEVSLPRLLSESAEAPRAILNYPEVLEEITARLRLEALEAGDDPELVELLHVLERACARHPHDAATVRRPVVPLEIGLDGEILSFLSVITHFGTSEDVTVRDLRLELFFPADERTRTALTHLIAC